MSLPAATVAVSAAAARLRLRGFAAACGSHLRATTELAAADFREAAALAAALARTAPLPWSSCLTRSLALCRLLRRRDLGGVLRIGTALTAGGELRAHAWVELNGRVVNDRDAVAGDFMPFPIPGERRR